MAGTSTRTSSWKILLSAVILLCVVVGVNSNPSGHGDQQPAAEDHQEGGAAEGEGHSEDHGGNHSEHGGHRYHVAAFDFGYVRMPLIVAIWVLYAGGAKVFFHWEKHLSKIFPESCMLIIIGIILGIILYFAGHNDYELNTTTFFLVLLPPIILDAGYYMPARPFFDQLGTILLYAVIGTLVNTIWLGFALWGVYEGGGFSNLESPLLLLHSLVFASLLAAVDPVAVIAVFEALHVNEILYIVVFGESLLNDGISVVLYHVFEGFSEIGIENILGIDIVAGFASFFVIVFGATGIGMLLGLVGGFISRFTHHVRIMEPLLVFVIGYISFLMAEMFHLSGILSCTFCGITMRKYVEANITAKSKTTIKYLLKMAATCCEIIIFMYLGISAVSDTHHWDTAFCILTLVFCLIFRALGVIVLTYLANLIRVVKLTKIDQFIMAYGGLRGAIAFALVVLLDKDLFPHRRMFITTTVLVIYFTNLAMGTTIEPLVSFLKVKKADHRKPLMGEKMTLRFMDHVMGGIEDIADQKGHHLLRERFSYVNNKWLKPLIVGRKNPQRRGWQIWSVYNRLNEKAAREVIRNVPSSASLTSLFRHASELDLSRTSSLSQLVPNASTMNRTGSFDSWIFGPNGSVAHHADIDRTATIDSLVRLDASSLEHDTHNIHRSAGKHNSTTDNVHGPRSTRDQVKRSVGKDGSVPTSPAATGNSSSSSRLYVPRRRTYSSAADGEQSDPTSPSDSRNRKNVSFAGLTDGQITAEKRDDLPSVEDQLPGVITFTTKPPQYDSEPSSAEASLPWKRPSDGDPLPSLSAHHARHIGGVDNEAFGSDEETLVSPDEPSSSESSQDTDTNTNNNNSNRRRRAAPSLHSTAAPPLPSTLPPAAYDEDQHRRSVVQAIGGGDTDPHRADVTVEMHHLPSEWRPT